MKPIFPQRLNKGSHIRVIAPSRSAAILDKKLIKEAEAALKKEGFIVSYGKHVFEKDAFLSTSIEARIEDIHDAFEDNSVDGILTAIGGYNANQLLTKIDYELIKRHPKVMCGFSDITVLSNAIFAKTGLVTYSGPHFSTWGMQRGFDYSRDAFMKCVSTDESFFLKPSTTWSDDLWFLNQDEREFKRNERYIAINNGKATGRIIGGHLRCLAAIQGTEYWPGLKDSIVFIEEDEEIEERLFDRLLESLTQQKDFADVRGIIIGRFQKASKISKETVMNIVKQKEVLNSIPVIYNLDIGHTSPILTFPIGGNVEMIVSDDKISIKIIKH